MANIPALFFHVGLLPTFLLYLPMGPYWVAWLLCYMPYTYTGGIVV